MANGSKQFHTKSRNGCGQCKRRRVRCNFQGPVCSNCHRRNESCDYLQDYNPQPPATKESQSLGVITLSELGRDLYQTRTVNPTDGYFYFSSCNALFVALDDSPIVANEQELLACTTALFLNTDCAPLTSFENDFLVCKNTTLGYLLPTISSLLAIQKTMRRGSESPAAHATALQHNITASARFRNAESTVHDGNWLPILMFGVGHIMFNFATAQSAPDRDFEYLSIFHVLRNTAKIGAQIGVFLENSELGSILESKRRGFARLLEPNDCLQAINQLNRVQHPEGTPEKTRRHCRDALERLAWWTRLVHGAPQIWKDFMLWPASVPDGFVTALTERQPVALLIYIYWCVVMHRAPKRWYADGWHSRIAVAAMAELGPEYDALLEWPSLSLSVPLVKDRTLPLSPIIRT
ncbi:hypothetical protein F5Y03DRAFT_339900 [Xylaria venustula]|nr:hypothetical protein F5Y03DRAFT_339900 [Xylaria venustula]